MLRHGEFENWAVISLGGIPNKVQVGDMGVDGVFIPLNHRRDVRLLSRVITPHRVTYYACGVRP